MSARKVRVELTEPQLRALVVAAGFWEDHHEPGELGLDPEEGRMRPTVVRARRRLMNALRGGWLGDPVAPLPFVPEHPRNRTGP